MPPKEWNPRTYETLEALDEELDRIERAHRDGTLKTHGNWSAGEILDHCSRVPTMALDGSIPANLPWYMRFAGRFVFKPMLGKSRMKPGIKLPSSATPLLPREDISFEDGLSALREKHERIKNGERMTHPSPLMGKMTHDQWMILHLDHCRMHFGFIELGAGA